MFLGVTETSVEMYPSFTAPSKSALHQHLNRDVFVISSNSDSDGTLLAVFQYAKSLSNKPGLRGYQLQRQHERDVYQLADLVHLHGHGSALLIGYWVANNMGYLHVARDKFCSLWSSWMRIWYGPPSTLAKRRRLQCSGGWERIWVCATNIIIYCIWLSFFLLPVKIKLQLAMFRTILFSKCRNIGVLTKIQFYWSLIPYVSFIICKSSNGM